MSWIVVLQIILSACAGSTGSVSCREKTYACVKRAAVAQPKADGADSINTCLSNPEAFPVPIASPSPSQSPSPVPHK